MRPAPDEVFTMAPPGPCATMCGISYFMHKKTPVSMTPIPRCQTASSSSAMGALAPTMPALLRA